MSHFLMSSPLFRTLAVAPFAVTAIAMSIAHAQVSPQMRSEAMSLMQVCRGDYDRLCGGMQPGGGRVLACLQNHAGQRGAQEQRRRSRRNAEIGGSS